MDATARMGLCEESHLTVPISMPHSERAMKLLNVVENYPQRTGPYQPRWGHESFHWRKIRQSFIFPSYRQVGCSLKRFLQPIVSCCDRQGK